MDTTEAKASLLEEIDSDIRRYKKHRQYWSSLQWLVLFSVTIAGFFTTAVGGLGSEELSKAWYASTKYVTIWGLISVVGAMIVQNANPSVMAQNSEKKKDAMRAIRTDLKYRGLSVKDAARLVQTARKDPDKATDMLLSSESSG
jgi:hypothetical protein